MFDHLAATVLYEMCVEQPTATVRTEDTKLKYPTYNVFKQGSITMQKPGPHLHLGLKIVQIVRDAKPSRVLQASI